MARKYFSLIYFSPIFSSERFLVSKQVVLYFS